MNIAELLVVTGWELGRALFTDGGGGLAPAES